LADSFYESFDNGAGALTHHWAGNIDTSVKGQITLRGYAGVMEHPSGSGSGHGYGQYTVTAKVEGNQVGPAALLWPSNDKWPGTEMDFVEVLPDGTAYGTAHNGNNGYDWYEGKMYWNVDESQTHTYGINWQPDRVSFTVDGRDAGTVYQNTKDAGSGGSNVVFGVMNKNDGTSITVYDMSYSPSGGGGGGGSYALTGSQTQGASAPPAAAPAAQSGSTDWNALAAQMTANYEKTGDWFV
jgi:beta-glucanase (GH16 family)